jgi:hypothetical protein
MPDRTRSETGRTDTLMEDRSVAPSHAPPQLCRPNVARAQSRVYRLTHSVMRAADLPGGEALWRGASRQARQGGKDCEFRIRAFVLPSSSLLFSRDSRLSST